MTDEVWHVVEARRDDGAPTMFRIRELARRTDQPTIFVAELPYPITGPSRMPDGAAARRLAEFEQRWLAPACAALGWTFVATKLDDGACFYYLYGAGEPRLLSERLAPFDRALAFFDEPDAEWAEYDALRELLVQAHPPRRDETGLAKPLPNTAKAVRAARARARRAARYRAR